MLGTAAPSVYSLTTEIGAGGVLSSGILTGLRGSEAGLIISLLGSTLGRSADLGLSDGGIYCADNVTG